MVHPDTELRFVSPAIGWGVFATRDIPTGTITWALDVLDQHLSDEDIRRLGPTRAILVDMHGVRYYVDDSRQLDAKSRRILTQYL